MLEVGVPKRKPKPLPEQKPPRDARPPAWLPSSDEAWLVEMMIQRLEVVSAAARAREVWGLPAPGKEEHNARLASFAEIAARVGLAPGPARAFYVAQIEAGALAEKHAIRRVRRGRDKDLTFLAPAQALNLLDALDAQLAATFLRLRGIPQGKKIHAFAREKIVARHLPAPAAKRAAEPFQPSTAELPVFTMSVSEGNMAR